MKLSLSLMLLVGVVIIGMIGLALLQRLVKRPPTHWAAYPRKLANGPEATVYRRLTEAFPNHLVFLQVAFSQLFGSRNRSLANHWRQKVADMVVCSQDFQPLVLIEVDGNSHDSPRRARADHIKNEVADSAGLLLYRINTQDLPSIQRLQADLQEALPPAALRTKQVGR